MLEVVVTGWWLLPCFDFWGGTPRFLAVRLLDAIERTGRKGTASSCLGGSRRRSTDFVLQMQNSSSNEEGFGPRLGFDSIGMLFVLFKEPQLLGDIRACLLLSV